MNQNNESTGIRNFFRQLLQGTINATGAAAAILGPQVASLGTPQAQALSAGALTVAVLTAILDKVIFGTLDYKKSRKESQKLHKSIDEIKNFLIEKFNEQDLDFAELLVDRCIQHNLNEAIQIMLQFRVLLKVP
jgi:hypothetical protein